MKYSFISKESVTYSDLANYYRGYATAKYNLTQKSYQGSIPLNITAVGGIEVSKSFLGFKYKGIKTLTTYDDAATMVEYFNNNSIKNINLIYTGALKGGFANESITRLELAEKLGNKEKLAELSEKTGLNLLISLDALTVPKKAPGYSRYNDTAKTIDDSLSKKYSYHPVTLESKEYRYIISPLKYNSFTSEVCNFITKNALAGTAFSDLGAKLYSHNDNQVITRQDTKYITLDELSHYTENRMLILSNPIESALEYADAVLDLPSNQNRTMDEMVPFYQMVYYSLVPYSGTPINEASDINMALLKCIETGEFPYFRLFFADFYSTANTKFSYLYSNSFVTWKDDITKIYNKINGVLSKTEGMCITSHERISNKVYKTVYGNKISVYTNYSDSDVIVNNLLVKENSFETEVTDNEK